MQEVMGEELKNLDGYRVLCDGRPIVKLEDDNVTVFTERLPACSIGEWLNTISFLRDMGYEVI